MRLKKGDTHKAMFKNFDEIRLCMSHFMSLHLENDGFSPLVGKIYTLLLFSSEPLCLQQIAEGLSVSKAAISVQIRGMVLRHLCHKVPIHNDRKDYYYITDDFEIHAFDTYTEKVKSVQQTLDGVLVAFPERGSLEPEDEQTYLVVKQRFKEMSLLCEMYIGRMRGLNEEWQLKKKIL
jgi:DNA-binding transcriptional regulator GbsR (MarR family)